MAQTTGIQLSKVYIDKEMEDAALAAMRSGNYILGKQVEAFESEFAAFMGSQIAIAVASGTAALQLSLQALGVKPGDEIIVPSHTAFPSIEPIFHCGAIPVFVDIDASYTIDPTLIEEKITSRTVGIVPVHLYGQPVDLKPILALAKAKNLFVLEDCAQGHNAEYQGKKVGTFGIAGCFSFYPSKNMTVCGDGGMIITNDAALARRIRMLRNHGRESKYEHEIVGYNLRFNEMQAAIGRLQLKKLDWFSDRRRALADQYDRSLPKTMAQVPERFEGRKPVYHLYVIEHENREALAKHLKAASIQTGVHYPVPNHLQPAVRNRMSTTALPKTERACNRILSLPMYPELTENEVERVCATVRSFGSGA